MNQQSRDIRKEDKNIDPNKHDIQDNRNKNMDLDQDRNLNQQKNSNLRNKNLEEDKNLEPNKNKTKDIPHANAQQGGHYHQSSTKQNLI